MTTDKKDFIKYLIPLIQFKLTKSLPNECDSLNMINLAHSIINGTISHIRDAVQYNGKEFKNGQITCGCAHERITETIGEIPNA